MRYLSIIVIVVLSLVISTSAQRPTNITRAEADRVAIKWAKDLTKTLIQEEAEAKKQNTSIYDLTWTDEDNSLTIQFKEDAGWFYDEFFLSVIKVSHPIKRNEFALFYGNCQSLRFNTIVLFIENKNGSITEVDSPEAGELSEVSKDTPAWEIMEIGCKKENN